MKRLFLALLCAALISTLTGCNRTVGGVYKLDHATADGLRLSPDAYSLNIQFDLQEGGFGFAHYNDTRLDIIWEDDGSSVTVTGPKGILVFTKQGKSLILHDEGTMLFFEPEEDE